MNGLASARQLGSDARIALPELRRLAEHRDPTVRAAALQAIGAVSPDERERLTAAEALGRQERDWFA